MVYKIRQYSKIPINPEDPGSDNYKFYGLKPIRYGGVIISST
jgi:hypothetical protein